MHGASKQAASKWKSRGVLVFSGDLVDIDASDSRMRGAGLGNFRQASTDPVPVDHLRQPVDRSRREADAQRVADRQPRRVRDLPDDQNGSLDSADGGDDLALVDDFGRHRQGPIHLTGQRAAHQGKCPAARQLLNLRKDAGELVEIQRAIEIFFDMTRKQRDTWITWPVKIGPLLAAELGVRPHAWLRP
jgi:hypothetical protein